MTATEPLRLSPVGASFDNLADWDHIAGRITSAAGLPTVVTPEMVAGMVGSAVALLFGADAAKDTSRLRGSFTDAVIAQCQRNAGALQGGQPVAAVIHLVGVHMTDEHPVLRAHVSVQVDGADGNRTVSTQFWDVQLGDRVTVGQPNCPNCGAPIATGELICGHCRTDVRSVVAVPLVVSRLEYY